MSLTQFVLMLKNQIGQLASVTRELAESGVNILGISAREGLDFTYVRIVVDDDVKTERILKEENVKFRKENGILVIVPHEPGSLYKVSKILADANININYLYIVVLVPATVCILFNVDKHFEAIETLKKSNLKFYEV